jgi:hypothetical protein
MFRLPFKIKQPRGGAVDVGWLLDADQAGFIWDDPKRMHSVVGGSEHVKSVSACPAVIDHNARNFVIPCPISVRLKLVINPETGEAGCRNELGDQSSIRSNALGKMIKIVPAKEWRHPQRPILQFKTPYLFVADEPVYLNQMPPFEHYRPTGWPGLMISGRFPVHIWPRQLMWAFEWISLDQPLVLERGEPWFYARFETTDPSRQVRLIEAELTDALREHIRGMSAVTNYVSQTYSLFKVAVQRRPKRLLFPKRR